MFSVNKMRGSLSNVVADSAGLGLGLFVRSRSRILRCLVGWSWLRYADICRLVRCGFFVVLGRRWCAGTVWGGCRSSAEGRGEVLVRRE